MFFYIIQELCKTKGVTLSHVLLELGMSKGNVTHWKNGKIPSSQNLKKLADYFGVSTDFLLGNPQELAKNIIDEFWKQNLNISQFEEYIDISAGSFEKWKKGTSTSFIKYLPKIADYLEVTIGFLLGYNFQSETLKIDNHTLDDNSLMLQIDHNPKIKKLINIAIALKESDLDYLLKSALFLEARDISNQSNK